MQSKRADTLLVICEDSLGLASRQVPQPDGGVVATSQYLKERSHRWQLGTLRNVLNIKGRASDSKYLNLSTNHFHTQAMAWQIQVLPVPGDDISPSLHFTIHNECMVCCTCKGGVILSNVGFSLECSLFPRSPLRLTQGEVTLLYMYIM